MKCYRESDCPVRLHGEGACRVRLAYDKCPNSLGAEDEKREMDSEAGASAEGGETTSEEM